MKVKVVINTKDKRAETIFFEADMLNIIDADSKLVIQKWIKDRKITMAVFNHWDYYQIIDHEINTIVKSSEVGQMTITATWKAFFEIAQVELNYKLKKSIIGSKIVGIDIQGTRIILRTDAKPVKHGDAIYDTSRIIVYH